MTVASAERAHRAVMRGDIEGLRAIAVVYVLFFHIFPSRLGGGFAGVDVFFVISGFLITSQLIREATRTGTVSLSRFYARRARRLLPAATVVLVFTGLASCLVLPPTRWHDTGLDVIAAALYVVNWALAFRAVDYLAEDSLGSPVQHYWSLSVEEQFYVIWPLIIILGALAARKFQLAMRPVLISLLTLVTASSFIYSVVHTDASPATAYFITTTRVWELGIGALVAFAVPWASKMSRGASQVLAMGGLILIALCGVLVTMQTPWPGYQALLPTLGSASVILAGCNSQRTLASSLLGLRPMVWVGGLSYALYLWHWPLLVFAETRFPQIGTLGLLGVGALSLVIAWLSRHLVEDPIRFHPVLSTRTKHALIMGAIGMILSVTAGLVPLLLVPKEAERPADSVGAMALVADPTTDAPFTVKPEPSDAITQSGSVYPDPALATEDVPAQYDDDCQVPVDGTEPLDRCSYGSPDGGTVVALVGDSKMGQWLSALETIGKDQDWRIDLYLKSSCTFANVPQTVAGDPYEDCPVFVENSLERMAQADRRPDLVFLSGGDRNSDESMTAGLSASIRTLTELGAKVVVVADNPTPSRSDLAAGTNVYECVSLVSDFSECDFAANEGMGTSALKRAASDVPGTVFVPIQEWFCPDGERCPAVIGGILVYRQGSHITDTYAESLAPILSRLLFAEGLVTSVLPAE